MKNLVLISGKLSSRNNENLCLICASAQNGIGQGPVISSDRETPGMLFVRIHSVKNNQSRSIREKFILPRLL